MATVTKEVREVFEEGLAIGTEVVRERKRHKTTTERLMARAAANVYAAHLVGAIDATGFAPTRGGEAGRADVQEAAKRGQSLTARGYGLLIGYSEGYMSRLFRLGFAIEAGVVDPEEKSEPGEGPTRWQLLSRDIGDSPEVGAVLGKKVERIPTIEEVDAAIEAARSRRRKERERRAVQEAEEEMTWIPSATGDRITYLAELATVIHHGRALTPKQIDRVREVMDELRITVEGWIEAQAQEAIQRAGNGGRNHRRARGEPVSA